MCDICIQEVPLVDYENRAQFVTLAYQAQSNYEEIIRRSVQEELKSNQMLQYYRSAQNVAFQSGPDSYRHIPVFDSTNFMLIQTEGIQALLTLTKQVHTEWCVRLNKHIFRHLLRAAQNYTNIITYYPLYGVETQRWPYATSEICVFKDDQFTEILTDELRNLFSGGFPICTMGDEGFVSQLLRRNFYLICRNPTWRLRNERGERIIIYPDLHYLSHSQMYLLLLVLAMGLHPRLGAASSLQQLSSDMLQKICMYIAAVDNDSTRKLFQAEERWLY
jgi:hypothetical protein